MRKFENKASPKSLKIINNFTISGWQAELTVYCRRDIVTLQATSAGKQKYLILFPCIE
jgi:hypothetical protein